MINLYYNYYRSDNEKRMKELDFCLIKAIENKFIDNVFVIISKSDSLNFKLDNKKITIVEIENRPTYNFVIELINKTTNNEDINVIINSDCYIDESTTNLIQKINVGEMWCMNKYDIIDDYFNLKFHGDSSSQDCWIFKGFSKKIENINFNFGTPGCDNRFAHESKSAGYTLKNPSIDIKILHYHLSQIRTCPHIDWDKHRINGDYEFVTPEKIL